MTYTTSEPKLQISKSTIAVTAILCVCLLRAMGIGGVSNAVLILCAAFWAVTILLWSGVPSKTKPVLIAFLLLGTLYGVLTVVKPSINGVTNTIGIFISAFLYVYFFSIAPKAKGRRDIILALTIGAAAIVLVGLTSDAVAKNTIGGLATYPLLLAGSLAVTASNRPTLAGCIFLLAVAAVGLILGHRTILAIASASALLFVFLRIAPSRIISWFVILGLAGSVSLLIAFYAGIGDLDIRSLNQVFVDLTGRNATSGRQVIWPIILNATAQSPWFGIGSGATFSQLYPDKDWSAHSYFLQTYMQTGFVGVALLIALLFLVWKNLPPVKQVDPLSCYALCLFCVVIIHSALEVFLMQTNIAIGAGAWMALGMTAGLGNIKDRRMAPKRKFKFT